MFIDSNNSSIIIIDIIIITIYNNGDNLQFSHKDNNDPEKFSGLPEGWGLGVMLRP